MASCHNLEKSTSVLRDRVDSLLQTQRTLNAKGRVLVSLAGVPGSGKSTISDALLRELAFHGIDQIAILPMDGFHHTKATLSSFKDPDVAFRRRGAPFTFDVETFLKHIVALKNTPVTECDDPTTWHMAPSFDHAEGDPVADAISIPSTCKLVIIEGNYVLLDEEPWSRIAKLSDDKWFVDVLPEVAKERLAQRHLDAGIETSKLAAEMRAEENDLPNGDLIRAKLIDPDVRILN